MTNRLRRLASCLAVAVVCAPQAGAAAQSIAVEGDHFVVDRNDGKGSRAKFLLFISYFDGLRAPDPAGDLDYIANRLQFDGIRVLVNWQRRTGAYCVDDATSSDRLLDLSGNVQGDTTPATGPLKKLIDLIQAAGARKLTVDVTFTRETYGTAARPAVFPIDNYIRGVTRVATRLRRYRNLIFDLQNEVDGNYIPDADVKRLRDSIVANPDPAVGDPSRIITVSKGAATQAVIDSNADIGTHAIAYHDSRDPGWERRVGDVVAALRRSRKPVYLQEPQAWNSGLTICGGVEGPQPVAGSDPSYFRLTDSDPSHFRLAVAAARAAGAAAWTFHTRQGFRLDAGTLRARIQSNPVEKDMLEGTATEPSLSARGATGPWGIDATPLREALQSIDGPGVMRHGIIVALLALLSGCVAPTEPSVPFRQVRPAGLLTQGFACQTRLRAIADAAEFNVLMAGIEFSEPPAVDFTRETPVVVSLGSRPTGGFAVDVRGVRKHGSEIVIDAVEMPPGACVTLPVVTCPWTLVIVPKTSAVDATWTTVARPCS